MTFKEFIGCAFTAFGPAFSMFYWTIVEDPVRIIIMIASAFFWLCSLLISSMIWYVFPKKDLLWVGILISVLVQEITRFLVYKMLRFAEQGLRQLTNTKSIIMSSTHLLAYCSGFGFGVISGAFSLVNVLVAIKGPGTMIMKSGSEFFCLYSALFTMCFIFLQTFWSVIFFHGLDNRNLFLTSYVLATHVGASCTTLLNESENYLPTVPIIFMITAVTGVIALSVAGATCKSTGVLFQFQSAQVIVQRHLNQRRGRRDNPSPATQSNVRSRLSIADQP